MAKKITQYSIFVSSPNDLDVEREEISNIISELNLGYAARKKIVLDIVKWETHSAPGISDTYTQDIINNDIGDNYDLFIGIIWLRFGTKTGVANSGTEEEFLNAVKRFKKGHNIQIIFYFKTTPPISLDSIDSKELVKIQQFKEYLKENNILYGSFNSIEELQTNLRLHIPIRIDELIKNSNGSIIIQKKRTKENIEKLEPIDGISENDDFGLIDFVYQFEDYISESLLALSNISESTKKIGEDINERTVEFNRILSLGNTSSSMLMKYFKQTAKSINSYSDRVVLETPCFYNNFEDAINVGLKYINMVDNYNINDNIDMIKSNYEDVAELKDSILSAIEGMSGFLESSKSLPNMQSDFNKSKRRLIRTLEILIFKLKKSYALANEFQGALEYKINMNEIINK